MGVNKQDIRQVQCLMYVDINNFYISMLFYHHDETHFQFLDLNIVFHIFLHELLHLYERINPEFFSREKMLFAKRTKHQEIDRSTNWGIPFFYKGDLFSDPYKGCIYGDRKNFEMATTHLSSMIGGASSRLDAYVDDMLAQVRTDITKEVNPEFEKLYSTEGSKEVSLELSEENHKLLVINFELFAKEKYTNKNKMIEVYETLTAA